MSTKWKCLITDADVLIHLHELGIWDALCTSTRVIVPATIVRREAQFYIDDLDDDDLGDRVEIDLVAQVASGTVEEISVTASEIARFRSEFDQEVNTDLHDGETEALTVMYLGKARDCRFCSADRTAIRALVLVGLGSEGVSLEQALRDVGLTRRSILPRYSEGRYQRIVKEASIERIQGVGLASDPFAPQK